MNSMNGAMTSINYIIKTFDNLSISKIFVYLMKHLNVIIYNRKMLCNMCILLPYQHFFYAS